MERNMGILWIQMQNWHAVCKDELKKADISGMLGWIRLVLSIRELRGIHVPLPLGVK